jgi:hypothetical protein
LILKQSHFSAYRYVELTLINITVLTGCLYTLLALEPDAATAITIAPTVDGVVRDGLDSPKDGVPDDILEGSIVQALDGPQFEDRGVIEFDISNISQSIHRVSLVLTIYAANGPFPFTIDVFTYAGDGSLSLNDFNLGSLYTSFQYFGKSNKDYTECNILH